MNVLKAATSATQSKRECLRSRWQTTLEQTSATWWPMHAKTFSHWRKQTPTMAEGTLHCADFSPKQEDPTTVNTPRQCAKCLKKWKRKSAQLLVWTIKTRPTRWMDQTWDGKTFFKRQKTTAKNSPPMAMCAGLHSAIQWTQDHTFNRWSNWLSNAVIWFSQRSWLIKVGR